jgi:hypothetical protein
MYQLEENKTSMLKDAALESLSLKEVLLEELNQLASVFIMP